MFYRPAEGHGLPHDPFYAVVSPRPIGWISTRGQDGQDNLAPYSFFNAVASRPPQVMFASSGDKPDRTGTKDTLALIRETGAFCVNVVGWNQREAMNATSAPLPAGADEFAAAGLPKAPCETIPCARVADAPAALECRLTGIVRLAGRANWLVLGAVTGVHLRDDCLRDGRLDVTLFRPVARLGYRDYAHVDRVWEMPRPGD
ncbi:flavin reductase family protein [Rubellimicrobium sp. CFH 75288]|uniref:flavin reductase family protein n=1 Tax=Rubellimicrobium sp. CFH 75288 TaxID=2697034 RepID=UPI001413500E|nr:flavin reductase family protein [Rubellimicrobium sp. CFH 75288]NAZ35594.1 flavin reductase family protein [Rubellimicrobium sp. CFH 75288]